MHVGTWGEFKEQLLGANKPDLVFVFVAFDSTVFDEYPSRAFVVETQAAGAISASRAKTTSDGQNIFWSVKCFNNVK